MTSPILIHVDDIEPNPASLRGVDGLSEASCLLTEHDLLVPIVVVPGVWRTYRIASGEYQWRTFVARRNLGFTQYEYIQATVISPISNKPSELPVVSATLLASMPPSVHQAGHDALEALRALVGGTYKYQPSTPTAAQASGTRPAKTVVVRTTLRQIHALIMHTTIADIEDGNVAALELEIGKLQQLLIDHGIVIPENDGDLSATLLTWVSDLALQTQDRCRCLKCASP